jgi:hypothetical protein
MSENTHPFPEPEGATMTRGFQQQDSAANFTVLKSAATPQHGQKPDKQADRPPRRQRSFEPRPGH